MMEYRSYNIYRGLQRPFKLFGLKGINIAWGFGGGLVCFLAASALLVAGFVLSHKGKLGGWLKVVWATPAPAAGKAEASETADTPAAEETADTADEPDEDASDTQTDTETPQGGDAE